MIRSQMLLVPRCPVTVSPVVWQLTVTMVPSGMLVTTEQLRCAQMRTFIAAPPVLTGKFNSTLGLAAL